MAEAESEREISPGRIVDFTPGVKVVYGERLIPSSLFVRVSTGGHVRQQAGVFFEIEDLRRECIRIWPGSGVLIDCYAQVAHENNAWPMSQVIEEANVRARQSANAMAKRLSGERNQSRRFLKAKFRIDIWPANGCVQARYLSEEEWAYEIAELGLDAGIFTEADYQKLTLRVPADMKNDGPAESITDAEFELPKRIERILRNRLVSKSRTGETVTDGITARRATMPTIEELIDLGSADTPSEIEDVLMKRMGDIS